MISKKRIFHSHVIRAKQFEKKDKIDVLLTYLDLAIKLYAIYLILGVGIGAFFVSVYLASYNATEIIPLAITNKNILIFLTSSSFIFATCLSIIAIISPMIYSHAKKILEYKQKTTSNQEILYDFFIFFFSLTIPMIVVLYLDNDSGKNNFSYNYIALITLVGLLSLFVKNTQSKEGILKELLKIGFYLISFVFGMFLSVITFTFVLKIISFIDSGNEHTEIIQYIVFFSIVCGYALIASIIINNENKIYLSIGVACYIIFVSMTLFPEYISRKIITFSKLGQYEANICLSTNLSFLNENKNTEDKYVKFWVLINLSNKIVVSENKNDIEYHVIPESYILDIKTSKHTKK